MRTAAIAALIMLASALALAVLLQVTTGELSYFQPSETPGATQDFTAPTNERSGAAVAYFTLDTAFVISFTLVFVGLYTLTKNVAPDFSRFALGAGIFTGVVDAIENALYWVYAMRAEAGQALTDPALELVATMTNLKLVGFFATYLTFALILPRTNRIAWLATLVMLLPPTIGLLSLGWREIAEVRPVLFSSPALLLFWVFAKTSAPGKPA
jgi:hypothetical protein